MLLISILVSILTVISSSIQHKVLFCYTTVVSSLSSGTQNESETEFHLRWSVFTLVVETRKLKPPLKITILRSSMIISSGTSCKITELYAIQGRSMNS